MPSRQSCSNAIGSSPLQDQFLVQHVQRFEHRHVGIQRRPIRSAPCARRAAVVLPPDVEDQLHFVAPLRLGCTYSNVERSLLQLAEADRPGPAYSQAAT